MILPVPFYRQTTPFNCGPAALRTVISYFDSDPGIELVESRSEISRGKGASTAQIGIAAASLGYRSRFFSKHLTLTKENLELEFYKQYNSSTIDESKKILERAKSLGVLCEEKTMPLKDILSMITKDSVPILLIDWNVVKGMEEKGYQGHFVPVIGCDDNNVYIHQVAFNTGQSNIAIEKSLFDKARKSQGTDEDVLVVYRKT